MATIRVHKTTGKLFVDMRIEGKRCREYSALNDTKTNRRTLEALLRKIADTLKKDCFNYEDFFPGSKNAKKFKNNGPKSEQTKISKAVEENINGHPTFEDFAETWVMENEIDWRKSYKKTISDIINGKLLPVFAEMVVSSITKEDILLFRVQLAKVKGRKSAYLSPKRINAIMTVFRQIIDEAADRFNFNTPYHKIKALKVPRTHMQPFTIKEVNQIINSVRNDYKNYYIVRFFTGMRTGEIDGLKWKYIDFERRLILIRETVVNGEEDYTKNDSSQRDIQMSEMVFDALKEQHKATNKLSKYVFCNAQGNHLDHNNVTKRVWYPLLRRLEIEKRRAYNSRHTAATLWLASGESPEWIARQMGHSTTEMLFRVYSSYVPNLTRKDGSAFENLLTQHGVGLKNEQ